MLRPLSFPTSEHRHKSWCGPPGPRPAPWPASRVWKKIDCERAAGPGGPARTRGSSAQAQAPLDFYRAPSLLQTQWHWAAACATLLLFVCHAAAQQRGTLERTGTVNVAATTASFPALLDDGTATPPDTTGA